MPDLKLRWHKHHGLSGLPLGIGLQSVFDLDVKFEFYGPMFTGAGVEEVVEMIFRGHSDHRSDKVYLPAEVAAGEISFMPFVLSPKPTHHNIEFHRKNGVFAVAGRHGEENAFGLSWEGKEYLRLAFPNETDKFPDTFILIELKNVRGEYLVVKVSSDFAKPREFVVGEPVVVKWEIVGLDDAPECLKKAVEDQRKNAEVEALALRQVRGAFARMKRT